MDNYTIARMLSKFNRVEMGPGLCKQYPEPTNVVFYGGSAHVIRYNQIFINLAKSKYIDMQDHVTFESKKRGKCINFWDDYKLMYMPKFNSKYVTPHIHNILQNFIQNKNLLQ